MHWRLYCVKKSVRTRIDQEDPHALAQLLSEQPLLSNTPIAFGPANQQRCLPLHYVCDAVFEGSISATAGLELAECLIKYGALVNGDPEVQLDTPLISAASLYCEDIGLALLGHGAVVHPRGTHGGTAVHWAAWTGSAKLLDAMLQLDPPLEDQSNKFKATPLEWAIDGATTGKSRNHRQQDLCIRLLRRAGAQVYDWPERISHSSYPALHAALRGNSY